jgi:hypothetical protein
MKLLPSTQFNSGDPAFRVPQEGNPLAPGHFFGNRRGLGRSRHWARYPSLSQTLAPTLEQASFPLQVRISRD